MNARSIAAALLLLSAPFAAAHAGGKDKDKDKEKDKTPPAVGPQGSTGTTGNPGGGNTPTLSSLDCNNYLGVIFRDFAATQCSGWWEGNEIKGSVPAAPVKTALENLGLVNPEYIEKLEFGDKDEDDLTKQIAINFDRPLYGTTVVGVHWGSGVFKNIPNAPKKLGTAFFWFDAGTTGLDKIYMSDTWSQSISNAALYSTGARVDCVPGQCCLGQGDNCNPVPEPASATLVGAGLLALGAAARRRRSAAR